MPKAYWLPKESRGTRPLEAERVQVNEGVEDSHLVQQAKSLLAEGAEFCGFCVFCEFFVEDGVDEESVNDRCPVCDDRGVVSLREIATGKY